MKNKILQLLKENADNYISGEDLSRRLDISRTAVWKHVNTLRKDGFEIQALPKKGYILKNQPDLLLASLVQDGLQTKALGRNIHHYDQLSSTNKIARGLAEDNCLEGTLVIAESQEEGRGRFGRQWFSPKGGIWTSIVLRPSTSPFQAPLFTILTAVSVYEVLSDLLGSDVGIKWPNDILYNNKKLVGILTEVRAEMESINYLIIGIGVNTNFSTAAFCEEVAIKSISIQEILGKSINRASLLQQLLARIEEYYIHCTHNGFKDILAKWKTYNVTLGKEVNVESHDKVSTGIAFDIDDDGALLIRKEDGTIERFLSGEVSITSSSPFSGNKYQ